MRNPLGFFYPPRCLLCGDLHGLKPDIHLCEPCAGDLRLNPNSCTHCAVPLDTETAPGKPMLCGRCLKSPPDYDNCWSPFIYAQPLEWMIQQLKFNAKLIFAPLLSELLIQHMPFNIARQPVPDAIIPMPLHPKRLKQRGFNQSLLLAKPLAKRLGIKIDSNSCRRVKDTEHQTGKNARQRQENIKRAFTFNNQNQYHYLVILDDVVTTGSSVNELSKMMKQAGVSRVEVWSLARADKIN